MVLNIIEILVAGNYAWSKQIKGINGTDKDNYILKDTLVQYLKTFLQENVKITAILDIIEKLGVLTCASR